MKRAPAGSENTSETSPGSDREPSRAAEAASCGGRFSILVSGPYAQTRRQRMPPSAVCRGLRHLRRGRGDRRRPFSFCGRAICALPRCDGFLSVARHKNPRHRGLHIKGFVLFVIVLGDRYRLCDWHPPAVLGSDPAKAVAMRAKRISSSNAAVLIESRVFRRRRHSKICAHISICHIETKRQ